MAIMDFKPEGYKAYQCISSSKDQQPDKSSATCTAFGCFLEDNINIKVVMWENGYIEIKQLTKLDTETLTVCPAPDILELPYIKPLLESLVKGLADNIKHVEFIPLEEEE